MTEKFVHWRLKQGWITVRPLAMGKIQPVKSAIKDPEIAKFEAFNQANI